MWEIKSNVFQSHNNDAIHVYTFKVDGYCVIINKIRIYPENTALVTKIVRNNAT